MRTVLTLIALVSLAPCVGPAGIPYLGGSAALRGQKNTKRDKPLKI